MLRWLFCCCFLTLFSSCGKQDFPDYDKEEEVPEHQEAESNYILKFKGLNNAKNRFRANGVLWIKGRQFYIKIVTTRSFPNQRFQQYIHTGSRCPTGEDDLNRDGIIDHQEVIYASGPMLIPLDKSLKAQEWGREWFPVADKYGAFYYSRATALPFMMVDLYEKDPLPSDDLVKLTKDEKLDPERRTVVIYGSPEDPLRPVACAEVDFDF